MKRDLQTALDNVEMTYSELVQIANDMTRDVFEEVDNIINSIEENKLYTMPADAIREYILRLSLKSYRLSEIKEKSSLKQECAETLRKEKYAISFNGIEGTVAFKENSALVSISEEVLVEAVYSLVASLFKTKLDEIHRFLDSLKSILISQLQEAKIVNMAE